MNQLASLQEALRDLADSVVWKCANCSGTGLIRQQSRASTVKGKTDQFCPSCDGTGCRWTKLHDAAFEPCTCWYCQKLAGRQPGCTNCQGKGYKVRSVQEFWWLVSAPDCKRAISGMTGDYYPHDTHSCLTLIAALKEALCEQAKS